MAQPAKARGRRLLPVAALVVILVVVAVGAGLYLSRGPSTSTSLSSSSGSGATVIDVVAAENFWGSLASQLGGTHANVTSVVSDPNADPHEYTSNPAVAAAITNANLVIVNGAGYDQWALSILASANPSNQVVLNVQQLLNQPLNSNPHFWYSPYYVNDTVAAIYSDLVKIDPADQAYFKTQYAALNGSLWTSYMKQETMIKQQFAGVPVASTEDIFVYMANATGLKVVSPPAFMQAVGEGNDPSAADIATFQNLLTGGSSSVRVLVYNEQTVTPLTQSIKSEAAQYKIQVIGVTETIQPPGTPFQAWMQGEVNDLTNALKAGALGQ